MSNGVTIAAHGGPQTEFLSTPADITIFGGSAGGGKAVQIDTKVLTPQGWSTVRELTVGDEVIDREGHAQTILQEHVQPLKTLYEVVFRDGAKITVCGEHLWDVNFSGHKAVRDTSTIKEWMERTGRNPTIPLYSPSEDEDIEFDESLLPIKPYTLGFLLGDGHFATCHSLRFSTSDEEVVGFVREDGYDVKKTQSSKYEHAIVGGLRVDVGELGLYNTRSHTKFVPQVYKDSGYNVRISILQGLMDSDGYRETNKDTAEFVSVSKTLSEDVQYLVRSVGGTATLNSKETSYTYKGEKKKGRTAYRLYIRHPNLEKIFRLSRKKVPNSFQKKSRNSIVEIREKGEGLSKCFTISGKESLFVIENFIVTHNSFALLVDPLRHIKNPDFRAIMFRRQAVEINRPGGLADASKKIYPYVGGEYYTSSKKWVFPSGATVHFMGLDHEDDIQALRGVEVDRIYHDELTTFNEEHFWYPQSRIRSTTGIQGKTKCSTNPQSSGFVKDLVKWWIDEDGFAIPERSSKLRYFIRDDDDESDGLKWFNSRAEAEQYYRDYMDVHDKDDMSITSLTFIRSSLDDNPSLGKEYKKRLMSLPAKERAELLGGNWNYDASSGVYFKKTWIDTVDRASLPKMKRVVRGWDLASTPVGKGNQKNPDWTVGVKVGLGDDGYYYILDVVRFRGSIGEVKKAMKRAAVMDGTSTHQVVPQDPGGHGKHAFQDHVKNLSGFVVRKAKTEKSKIDRFLPFASSAEYGLVKMVEAEWNNPFLMELEGFVGDGRKKDDQVDAVSDAYKELHQGQAVPTNISLTAESMAGENMWNF